MKFNAWNCKTHQIIKLNDGHIFFVKIKNNMYKLDTRNKQEGSWRSGIPKTAFIVALLIKSYMDEREIKEFNNLSCPSEEICSCNCPRCNDYGIDCSPSSF